MNDADRLAEGVAEERTVAGSVSRLLHNVGQLLRGRDATATDDLAGTLSQHGEHLGRLVLSNTPVVTSYHPKVDTSTGDPNEAAPVQVGDDGPVGVLLNDDDIESIAERVVAKLKEITAKPPEASSEGE